MKQFIIIVLTLACFYFAGVEDQTNLQFIAAIAAALVAIKLEKSDK